MKNELDLHGVKHHDVDRLVENFILLHTTPSYIITGQSDIMRDLVTTVLKRHQYTWEIPGYNTGVIIIGEANEKKR